MTKVVHKYNENLSHILSKILDNAHANLSLSPGLVACITSASTLTTDCLFSRSSCLAVGGATMQSTHQLKVPSEIHINFGTTRTAVKPYLEQG